MKRSEILAIIEDTISPCNSTYKAHREETAIRILKKLEEVGMFPPLKKGDYEIESLTWESE